MSNDSNLQDNFKLISYKKRNKKHTNTLKSPESASIVSHYFDSESAIRRIKQAKQDILTSDLYSSLLASLKEGQSALLQPEIREIVCLGLGKIGECTIARYQLGLLLCLKDLYEVNIRVFDPIFTEQEIKLLKEFSCDVLIKNIEGKYHADHTTLFFLPHCPMQLSNNLLWANWNLHLSNCVIIANSFTNILERSTKKIIQENAGYILSISPYILELAIINTFKFYEVFNDLAVHVFPYKKLCLLSEDFWKYKDKPEYPTNDIEFVRNKLDDLRIVSFSSEDVDRDDALT